jgi:glyoxylase-like metal-dependent hydrolase (beta-lactamase superfamily II)
VSNSDWQRPGAFEVAENVYRIPLPLPNDGLRAVNVYALVGPDGLVVIDAGWAVTEGREALQAGLALLNYSPADITEFLVTHIHRDHYTQAMTVRHDFGTKVSLGEGERANLDLARQPGSREMKVHLEHMRSLGAARIADKLEGIEEFPHDDIWELQDRWLLDHEQVYANGRSLDVVPTPGHTHGHVVFHDVSNALLFAGDHVLPSITPSIGFEADLHPDPLGDYLRSLLAVRELPDAMLLPAHGEPGPSVHRRVEELLDHHSARLDQSRAAVAAGASTAYEAAHRLLWTSRGRTFAELNLFNQMLAVAETSAHLRLLHLRGELTEKAEDGVVHYEL